MLHPQTNPYRQTMPLPDFWDFRPDPEDRGRASDWTHGFSGGGPIAVPASWNDQFAELRDYGKEIGFQWVESNPLVRSSYHAAEQVRALSVVHRKLYGESGK